MEMIFEKNLSYVRLISSQVFQSIKTKYTNILELDILVSFLRASMSFKLALREAFSSVSHSQSIPISSTWISISLGSN